MAPPREEADYLPLSGIQHFAFCPRQWALIHVEGQWVDNVLTAKGRLMHEKVDQAQQTEARENRLICRAVPLVSSKLGLTGRADVVEFTACIAEQRGVVINGRTGQWQPAPVEYKRGKPKSDDRDAVQLCAQGMCLEEMLSTVVAEGAIFYGQTRRRERVAFTTALRERVATLAQQMHELAALGQTPAPPLLRSGCARCSLADRCLPNLRKRRSTSRYIRTELTPREDE